MKGIKGLLQVLRADAHDRKPSQFIRRFDDWRDNWLWVFWTFLRGRVLRQKRYLPQNDLFNLSATVPLHRVKMLMGLWGVSVMTLEEYRIWTRYNRGFCRVLALGFDDERGWRISGKRDDWGYWATPNQPILVFFDSRDEQRILMERDKGSGFKSRSILGVLASLHLATIKDSPVFELMSNTTADYPSVLRLPPSLPDMDMVVERCEPNTACPHAPIPLKLRRKEQENRRFQQRQRIPRRTKTNR